MYLDKLIGLRVHTIKHNYTLHVMSEEFNCEIQIRGESRSLLQ